MLVFLQMHNASTTCLFFFSCVKIIQKLKRSMCPEPHDSWKKKKKKKKKAAVESGRRRRGGRHDLAVYPQCLSQNF